MNEYLKTYLSMREEERKKVLAAATWGNGPFTRIVFREHFPKIANKEIADLIHDLLELKS